MKTAHEPYAGQLKSVHHVIVENTILWWFSDYLFIDLNFKIKKKTSVNVSIQIGLKFQSVPEYTLQCDLF